MKRKMRKNSIRHLAGILAAAIAAAALCGCAASPMKKTRIKKALEDKYGETFFVDSIYRHSLSPGSITAQAYAAVHPDLPFLVVMDADYRSFSDGYVMKLGTQMISRRAQENLGALKKPYYLHTQSMFPDSVSDDPGQSLEEYLSSEESNFFTIYLYINPEGETPESLYAAIRDILSGMENMDGSLEIFLTGEGTMDKARGYVVSHASLEDEYVKIGEKYHVLGIRFKSGTLGTSREEFESRLQEWMR